MNDGGELMMTEQLAVREEKLLEQCEAVISADLKAFIRVGKALATIKAERLYRSEFLSFEDYVATKWDMGVASAKRFLSASEVVDTLTKLLPGTSLLTAPIGAVESQGDYQVKLEKLLPKNEAQARALTQYKDDPEKLKEVWLSALRTAPEGKMTAKHVEKTISLLDGVKKQEQIKRLREAVDKETQFSPQFKAAFNALWAVIQEEVMTKYKTTSKEAIRQHAYGILDVVGH